MQLKIVRIRGQCRGRPPTRAPNKDGPEPVGGQQSAVGSLRSAVWNRGSPDESVFKRRRRHWYRVLDPELKHINSRLKTQDSKLPHARDWVNITCSASTSINRNRDNDRSGTRVEPAIRGGTGEVCRKGNDNDNDNNVEC
jgi:hypothetical protein